MSRTARTLEMLRSCSSLFPTGPLGMSGLISTRSARLTVGRRLGSWNRQLAINGPIEVRLSSLQRRRFDRKQDSGRAACELFGPLLPSNSSEPAP